MCFVDRNSIVYLFSVDLISDDSCEVTHGPSVDPNFLLSKSKFHHNRMSYE